MITWNTDVNSPCCPGEIVNDDGRTVLIQTDTDYPSVAAAFGWSIREVQRPEWTPDSGAPRPPFGRYPTCDHSHTDGTVDCPDCGVTAAEFIAAAREYLENNNGAQAEDPGYFD